jgi:hypothetical protein
MEVLRRRVSATATTDSYAADQRTDDAGNSAPRPADLLDDVEAHIVGC